MSRTKMFEVQNYLGKHEEFLKMNKFFHFYDQMQGVHSGLKY